MSGSGFIDYAAQRQQLLDSGVSPDAVNQWQQTSMQSQLQSGEDPAAVNKMWGVHTPAVPPSMVQGVQDHMPPEAKTFSEGMAAAFGQTATGTWWTHGHPSYVMGKDPGFSADVGSAIGQLADMPLMLAGGALGAQVGAAAGLASGAESGPGALATGATGGVLGFAAGSFALPAYMRSALLQSYRLESTPHTWRDTMSAMAKPLWAATKGAEVGITAAGGEELAGSVAARAGLGMLPSVAARVVGFNAGMTGATVAQGGHIDATDLIVGSMLGLGLGVAGHVALGGRIIPNETGQVVADRLGDIYERYGAMPQVLGAAMRSDLAVRTDVLAGMDANMEPVQPALLQYAPIEPTVTYHGSGALFHQFDDNYLSSGEGAQARGYGHYLAENRDVGEGYMRDRMGATQVKPGYLYRSELTADQDHLIDQDTPIGQQSQFVQDAVGRAVDKLAAAKPEAEEGEQPTPADQWAPRPGENMGDWLHRVEDNTRRFGNTGGLASPQELSKALASEGIAGHKFLDAGSREEGKEQPTRNYVVFNPEHIRITHVNGEPLEHPVVGEEGQTPAEVQEAAAEEGQREHANSVLAMQGDNVGGFPPQPPDNSPPIAEEPEEPPEGQKLLTGPMTLEQAKREISSHIVKATKQSIWSKLNPIQYLRGLEAQLAKNVRVDRALGTTDETMNVEGWHRWTYGSAGRASARIRFGTIEPGATNDEVTGEDSPENALKLMVARGGNYGEFEQFLTAARIVGREAAGSPVKTPISPEAAHVLFGHTDMRYKYLDAANMIARSRDNLLDYGEYSGSLSSAQVKALKETDPYYVVFHRAVDPDYNPPRAGLTFGFRDPVKKIQGSNLDIVEPIQTLYDNYQFMQAMFDRNRANTHIVDLIKAHDITGLFTKVGEDVDTGAELLGELQDAQGNLLDADEIEKLKPFLMERAIRGRFGNNTFTVRRNGRAEVWRATDPDMAAMMNQTAIGMPRSIVGHMFAGAAKLLKVGITLDPSFMLRASVVHGQVGSAITGEHGTVPLRDMIAGLPHVWAQDGPYRNFLANGGGIGQIDDMIQKYMRAEFHETMEKSGTFSRVLNAVQSPIQGLMSLYHMLDAASRVGYAERMKRMGYTPMDATVMSRRAYMDHAEPRNAAWAQWWARSVPFMDLGFRDIEQLGRALRERPAATLLKGSLYVTAPTISLWFLNYAADQGLPPDLQYKHIAQFIKDNYWVLPPIMGHRVKIRKPYATGFAFATLPERFLDWAVDHDPDALKGLKTAFFDNVVPPFVPALLAPGVEMWANKDLYTGRPIVPDRLEHASGYMQYTPYTTPLAKQIAAALGPEGANITSGVSPMMLDQAVRGWTGTTPMTIMRAIGAPWQDRPFTTADLPWFGSFFVRHGTETQPVIDFYKRMEELDKRHQDLTLDRQQGNMGAVQGDIERGGGAPVAQWRRAMGNQYAVIRAISHDTTLTSAEKERLTDQIDNQMIEFAQAALAQMKAYPP